MGLDYNVSRMVLFAARQGVDLTKVLTLGRQNLNLRAKQLNHLLREFGRKAGRSDIERMKATPYSEDFLKFLGAGTIDSMDISAYEGATVLHDLNLAVPEGIHRTYDTIIDGGVTGHVFNFPVMIKNLMDMLKVGGHLVSVTYANNTTGDSFYQFAPEAYFSILSARNGFRVRGIFLVEVGSTGPWFRAANPSEIGRRVTLINSEPTYLMIFAQKIAHMDDFPTPQQSDYVTLWGERSVFGTPVQKSGLRARVRALLKKAVPEWLVGSIQERRRRWEVERNRRLKHGRFYTRFDPAKDSVLLGGYNLGHADIVFRTACGLGQGFASFEEAFHAGEHQRPAARNAFVEFGVRGLEFLRDGELHAIADRLQIDRHTRITFGCHMRTLFVPPRHGEAVRIVEFQHLAAVQNAVVPRHHRPGCADLPLAILPGLDPIFAGEFRLGQRVPQPLGRGADIGDVGVGFHWRAPYFPLG